MPNFDDDDMMNHLEDDDSFYDEDEELAQNAELFESNWMFDDDDEDIEPTETFQTRTLDELFPQLCMHCGEPLPQCVCALEDIDD